MHWQKYGSAASKPNENQLTYYNYLMNLAPKEALQTDVDINFSNMTAKYDGNNNLVLTMNFEFTQQNADNSTIEPVELPKTGLDSPMTYTLVFVISAILGIIVIKNYGRNI